MRAVPICVLVCLPLLFSDGVAAQQPAASGDQAILLVQKARALTAGATTINDVAITGSARRIAGSEDENGTVSIKALATGEARIELAFPSGTRSEVRNNTGPGPRGQWTGPDGKSNEIVQHNLVLEWTWFCPALLLQRAALSGTAAMSLVGNEDRNGRAVEHVSISQQTDDGPAAASSLLTRLSRTEVYLDSSSLLPVAIAFNAHPDRDAGTDIPIEIRFSDYRTINGAQVPFHVQKYANGGLILDLQFESVAVNTGLSTSAFSIQ